MKQPRQVSKPNEQGNEQPIDLAALEAKLEEKIKAATSKQESQIQELIKENAVLLKESRNNKDEVTKLKAKQNIDHQDSMPYPTGKRPNKYAAIEAVWKNAGVGQKQLKFVRKKYSGAMMLSPEKVLNHDGSIIRLMYCTNIESPFVEDHPRDANWRPETKKIQFSMGRNENGEPISYVIAPPSDPCLQRFLLASPDHGTLFELEDRQAIADERLARVEKVHKAMQFVDKLFESEDQEAPHRFCIHASDIHTAKSKTDKDLKLHLYDRVSVDPDLPDTYNRVEEDCKFQLLYARAEQRGLLIVKGNAIVQTWNNKRLGFLNDLTAPEAFIGLIKQRPDLFNGIKERLG